MRCLKGNCSQEIQRGSWRRFSDLMSVLRFGSARQGSRESVHYVVRYQGNGFIKGRIGAIAKQVKIGVQNATQVELEHDVDIALGACRKSSRFLADVVFGCCRPIGEVLVEGYVLGNCSQLFAGKRE